MLHSYVPRSKKSKSKTVNSPKLSAPKSPIWYLVPSATGFLLNLQETVGVGSPVGKHRSLAVSLSCRTRTSSGLLEKTGIPKLQRKSAHALHWYISHNTLYPNRINALEFKFSTVGLQVFMLATWHESA